MATEREEFVFGLRYEGQGAVADLMNDLGHVRQGVSELGREVQSSGFERAGASLLEAIQGTLRQQYSALTEARARLLEANAKAEDVARRVAITAQAGGPSEEARKAGGYGSASAQLVAQSQAARGESAAARALDKAYEQATAAIRQENSAHEAIANVGRIVARRLSEEAAAGTGVGGTDQKQLSRTVADAVRRKARADEAAAAVAERDAAAQKAQTQKNLDDINKAHYKRIQAEDALTRATQEQAKAEQAQAQASASRLASVDAELAARNPTPYTTPDTTTDLGRRQEAVNRSSANLDLANRKLADEEASTARTYESVRRAQIAQEAAQLQLAAAQRQLAVATERESGSMAAQFLTGFKGVSDRPYAEQIGQAFKFSVLYGSAYKILFGITQTLQQTLQEGIAFEQAMTELKIASGQTADQMDTLRKNLGDQATQAGAAPSQGVIVGARSLGLFGATAGSGVSVQQQNQIAEISARVVSRAAFSSGQQPEDLQRNIAAIANAFGQGATGQVRAYDLDAYLSRKFGLAPGGTFAPVSESATVGQAAGFNQEQITAIAAALQARTGQTGEAVAGFMAQIFSRAGEGALTQVDQKYGVDPTQSLADQVKELARVYRQNASARDEISAVFGRGKVQNAAIALLQDYPNIQKAAAQAQTGAAGAGDAAFNQRLDNVGGQLQILGGDLKAFASELGRSGVLTVLGVAIKTFDELVRGTTGLLEAFNSIDGSVRALLSTLALATIAYRVHAAVTAADTAATGERSLATGMAGFVNGGGGAAAGTLGARAVTAAQVAGIVASVIVAGNTIQANRRLDTANQSARNLLNYSDLGPNATATDMQSRAAALRLQADQATESAHGIFAWFIDRGNELVGGEAAATRAIDAAKLSNREAARLQDLAAYQQKADAAQPSNTPLISDFSQQGLSTSLDLISTNGGNANDRLNALAATLNDTADAATRATASFDPKLFAGQNAQGLLETLRGTGYVGQGTPISGLHLSNPFSKSFYTPQLKYSNALPSAISSHLDATGVQYRLQRELQSAGITSLDDLTPQIASQIAGGVVGDTPQKALADLGITDPKQITKLKSMMVKAIKQSLLQQARTVKDIIRGNVVLSPADATNALAEIQSETQAILGNTAQTDHGSRIAALRRQVQLIMSTIKSTSGGTTSQEQDALDAARRALAEEQIAELEDMRRAAQQNAKSKKQVAAIGHSFLVREINVAIRNQDQDALVGIIQVAGKGGIQIARNAIAEAMKTARAAIAIEQQVQQFAANEVAGIRGMISRPGPSGGDSQASKDLQNLQNMLAGINGVAHGNAGTNNYLTGGDANLPPSLSGSGSGAAGGGGPTAAQIAAARQSAYASGSESQIAQARAAMATARADMAAAKKGTTDYYSALGAYLQARNQLTDAIQAYHNNLFLLSHDATDPVVQARAAMRAAAAKLRADAGKPADVRAQDRVDLQSTQAELESARFNKRLEAAQTAEQLGQISFRAYMNYLDHEHDRLEGIKHRTYQQQQELNQIDQLMQEAAQSMQGVWNFGDIQLPKPYQVKRYIEENYGLTGGAGIGGGGSSITNDNKVYVNGADVGMVIRIIKEVLGANVHLETTKPRKR